MKHSRVCFTEKKKKIPYINSKLDVFSQHLSLLARSRKQNKDKKKSSVLLSC